MTEQMNDSEAMPATKGLKRPALAALIPGTKYDPKTFEVSAASDPEAPTVVFNIRGTIFETYRSNLYRKNLSNLSNEEFLTQFYRVTPNDYFFDRDPSLFSSVLEYQRTGVLHIPVNVCGKVARQELEFWGIDESRIEKCCWSTFDSWNSTYDALKQLEEAQTRTFNQYTEKKIAEMKFGRFRAAIWNFLSNPRSSHGAKIYGMITVVFIILSVLSFIIATHPVGRVEGERDILGRLHRNRTNSEATLFTVPHPALITIDFICLAFFTFDLITRFLTCPEWKKFVEDALNIVDFIAILPDYIDIIVTNTAETNVALETMHYVNFLRIFRALRIFRLVRYVPGLWIMLYTFKASFWDLLLMICFMNVGMIMFATFIYYAEEENFPNILIGMWWALITMTTVGYGDMSPSSDAGYLVGSLCAVTGLLMVGFTVPIIVSNFVMYYKHMQSMQQAEKREKKAQEDLDQLQKLIETEQIIELPAEEMGPGTSSKLRSNEPQEKRTPRLHISSSSKLHPPSYDSLPSRNNLRRLRVGIARNYMLANNNKQTTNGSHILKKPKETGNPVPSKNNWDNSDIHRHMNGENSNVIRGPEINDIETSML
ncbi:potassium voltage-gated channel protein Shaw [Octopus bimaculoides]|uniref:BTB domain-containing protein n=1 Tax=Octopus bimaculoides TaxID=37653 RepID=A0A0L8HV49_OCTBM|nr:potassium voltage-gated channel protein Shaw [Octopus bimaculoides]XP_014769439.1 potassium voltage-gated channel protein Shaw [Octopus bimaculoides]XP_014769440.1 potassium voltage-gated channel protein Shaw [Octopus bimaculoides]|eukprot:XP_014769438.1 PREDICTED: potassium voltage-gated channel protein Shaw-like [Octopus bimaculoides]